MEKNDRFPHIINKHAILLALAVIVSQTTLACTGALASKYALIIGIESYSNGVPPLNGPELDAINMKEFLVSFGNYNKREIKLLINDDATRENILTHFDTLSRKSDTEDEVLIYYSGHGSQVEDFDNDEGDRLDETIVPVDTVLVDKQYRNMITDDEVRQKIELIKAKKVHFIIDSCHSGTVTRSIGGGQTSGAVKTLYPELDIEADMEATYTQRRTEETFFHRGSEKNVSVWTAASSSQLAFTDIESRKGSLFTNRLIKGLKEKAADNNGDGVTTNAELLEYLRDESASFCKRNKNMCTLGLTPTYEATAKDLVSPVSFLESPVKVDTERKNSSPYVDAIATHNNAEELAVALLSGDVVKLGEKIQLSVKSPFSGYLFMLDINSKGKLTQLYPNEYSKRKWEQPVKQGEDILFPGDEDEFDFVASLPLGKGQVIAVVVEDQISLSTLLKQNMSLQTVTDKEGYLANLAYSLRKINTSDTFNKSTRWSVQKLEYTLIE